MYSLQSRLIALQALHSRKEIYIKHGAAPAGQCRPVNYNDCCPPSCYTFAFDGLSTVAARTTPPVLSCRADLFRGWCDCSVYPTSRRDTRSTVFTVLQDGDGFCGVSPNSRKLVLTTEEFNCQRADIISLRQNSQSSRK